MWNCEGGEWFLKVAGDLRGKRVVEFGDQLVWEHARPVLGTKYEVARDWFVEDLGVAEYVSIDWNGQHGAVKLDLSRPLDRPEWHEHFDVVTNAGTLEHIEPLVNSEAQYEALKNAHYLCKVGGLMVHSLPPVGQWLDHCRIRYRDTFAEVLARLNGYEVVSNERTNLKALGGHVDYLDVAFRKVCGCAFTGKVAEVLEVIEWT